MTAFTHSLSCMVGDCSTVTTEEPLRELGYGEIYSPIHLCHFIITAVPAEPRLVLHEILLQPLSLLQVCTVASADGPAFICRNAGKWV